jgi:hypothetical protein
MEGQSISLYLDLEKGQNADLEIVAKASLALLSALRDAAFILDPSVEIRLEFESGTEGSLSLNTKIKALKRVAESALPDKPTLKILAWLVMCWFANDLRQFGTQEILNHIWKGEDKHISEEQKQEIAAMVSDLLKMRVAADKVGEVFVQLEKDKVIKGVGATEEKGRKPPNVVPRSEFKERSSGSFGKIIEETIEKRAITTIQVITLVSPVLLQSSRMWRFRAASVEFGAKIADASFQNRLLSGKLRLPMKSGIQLLVEMKTEEEKLDSVWVTKGRTILKVLKVLKQPIQTSLDFRSSEDEDQSD